MLRGLPESGDPNVLVGSATADDAGIYRLDDERALVQTLDFFTPIVDDPFLYGKIAATNSISDVYAMGGRPLTAMAIAGMPEELPAEAIREIFRGGAEVAKAAGCALVGGHTIKNPEPVYGLSVTGLVRPGRHLANAHGRAGEVLVLTKPLGTGILSTAIKRGECPAGAEEAAVAAMTALNTAGTPVAEEGLARACTDVTGFGLLGHLAEMCEASGTGAVVEAEAVPALHGSVLSLVEGGCVPGGTRKNLASVAGKASFAEGVGEARRLLLADAQTSGGLLIACPEENLGRLMEVLDEHGTICKAVVGRLVEGEGIEVV